MYNLQIKLTEEQEKQLKELAKKELRTASNLASYILTKYLQDNYNPIVTQGANVVAQQHIDPEDEKESVPTPSETKPSKKVTLKNDLGGK